MQAEGHKTGLNAKVIANLKNQIHRMQKEHKVDIKAGHKSEAKGHLLDSALYIICLS